MNNINSNNNNNNSGSDSTTDSTMTGLTNRRRIPLLKRPGAGTMGFCAARGTTMMLCLIAALGLYLGTMTIMFTERIRRLESEVANTTKQLKLKERELYIKQLQLGDTQAELNQKSSEMFGVSDRLHQDAETLAEQAELKKQIRQGRLNSRLGGPIKLQQGHTKPKFVFNIGPMKTGSTTLQNYGQSDRILLRQNGYVWPASPFSMIYASITPSTQCMLDENDETKTPTEHECPSFDQERIGKLKVFLKRNEHLHTYLCDEMFGVLPDKEYVWDALQFMEETHELELVVTYRRYFEWWVSFYVQAFKYEQEEELITEQWPEVKLQDVSPDDRYTNHVIPHSKYFDLMQHDETSIFMRRWGVKHGEKHPTQAQKDRFEPHFQGEVKVFNYHLDKDNLVASFYCHMMPEATAACAARTRVGTKAHLNSAVNHNYDILAVAAYEAGLIQTEFPGNTRKQMAAAAQHRQEKMLNLSGTLDFPMVCMSDVQLEDLLEMSLKFEQEIVPDWANEPGRVEEHRAAFQTYVEKKKFCNIDAAKVLEDEEWQSFFRYLRLKPEPHKGEGSVEKIADTKPLLDTDRSLVRIPGTNRFRTVIKPKPHDNEGGMLHSIGRPASTFKNRIAVHA